MSTPAPVSDEWIMAQADSLYRACGFVPAGAPFLLDPAHFDSLGDYRDQVRFLVQRHGLTHLDVAVHMHGHLETRGRPCSGLAHLPVVYDTSGLGPHQHLFSVSRDGAHAVADSSDPERPVIRLHRAPIPLSRRPAAIRLDQSLIGRTELLGGVIAHEVAHLYLSDRGVYGVGHLVELIDEYRTDVAIFVMGLGLLALRAGPGYLSHRQMRLAHERVLALTRLARSDRSRP
jgi:hypothetical protein